MKDAKTLLALLAATLLTYIVCAKDKDYSRHGDKPPGHAKKEKAEKEAKSSEKHASTSSGKIRISTQEREIIQTFVTTESSKKNKSLPPGLQKKLARGGELPPGWQKKVVVGQVMPPDVLKISSPLPKELILKLPPLPTGTITVAVEGKVVRLMEKTREILDILDL